MKANELPAITPGSMWVYTDGSPFGPKPDACIYTVYELRDGWVRYGVRGDEERISERSFREHYVPVPRDYPTRTLEGELRQRFERIADRHNWSTERTIDGHYRFDRTEQGWTGFLWASGVRT